MFTIAFDLSDSAKAWILSHVLAPIMTELAAIKASIASAPTPDDFKALAALGQKLDKLDALTHVPPKP